MLNIGRDISMEAQMLGIDADQLGAPQRPGIAEQQQGAVPEPGEIRIAGPHQGADLGGGQRHGLAGRGGMGAGDAAQRGADRRVTAVEGVARLAVHPGDRGQAAAERRQRVGLGLRREVALSG